MSTESAPSRRPGSARSLGAEALFVALTASLAVAYWVVSYTG